MLRKKHGKLAGITIAIFAVAGLGLGLTGYIGMGFAEDSLGTGGGGEDPFADAFIAIVFLQSILVTLFAGPLVAVISGVISGHVLQDRIGSIFVGGAGSFVGFFIMIVLAVIIMSMGFSGGGGSTTGGGGPLGETLRPMIQAAIPTTLAGAVAGLLGSMFVGD